MQCYYFHYVTMGCAWDGGYVLLIFFVLLGGGDGGQNGSDALLLFSLCHEMLCL